MAKDIFWLGCTEVRGSWVTVRGGGVDTQTCCHFGVSTTQVKERKKWGATATNLCWCGPHELSYLCPRKLNLFI